VNVAVEEEGEEEEDEERETWPEYLAGEYALDFGFGPSPSKSCKEA
jgi:hypothetical protein